jgi:hypothetical protein
MSDTPYFDEYERRRRTRTLEAIHMLDNITGMHCNTAGTVYNTTTVAHILEVYPKNRLQKTYTFIGDIRVVQDCFIESKASSVAEWVQVDGSFNAYSFV